MPSRNNPNKPTRSSGRAKARAPIAPKIRGTAPTGPKVDSKGFIRSGRVSKKKERKKHRDTEYAKARELEQEELQKLIETGEVEMKDSILETMSKTQRKKLEKQMALESAGAKVEEGNGDVDMGVE